MTDNMPSQATDRPIKRRPGTIGGGLAVADPRPAVVGDRVSGTRCMSCGYASPQTGPWCPVCHKPVEEALFGPQGTVWAATVVRIPIGQWRAPFGLAYVDLDEGPRVLAHLVTPEAVAPGTRVRIVGTERGDILVDVDKEITTDETAAAHGADR